MFQDVAFLQFITFTLAVIVIVVAIVAFGIILTLALDRSAKWLFALPLVVAWLFFGVTFTNWLAHIWELRW